VTMNVLLWRAEYGSRGGGISVPLDLVWKKNPDSAGHFIADHLPERAAVGLL